MDMKEIRAKRQANYDAMKAIMDKAAAEGRSTTQAEADAFDSHERVLTELDALLARDHTGNVSNVSRDVTVNRSLIGTDTHDLPSPGDGRPLEARHSLTAYLSQRADFNPSGLDLGSFDRDAFWRQLITRNQAGREYRALAEGAQSVTASGGGWLAPIGFSANVLELLRAALVFTNAGADGSLNGPQIVDMKNQVEYVPVWSSDASNVTAYIGENTALTPGNAALGVQKLQAYTMANVTLASRQLVEDSETQGGLADLIEQNLAAAMARGMDQSALYGTGTAEPVGLFTSPYAASLQSVTMATNGAAPADYTQISQAVEKVRNANEPGDLSIMTNPSVFGTYSRLSASAYAKYWDAPADVAPFWPPLTSTAFANTETQGTSSVASSVLVANTNRIMLGLRTGLAFQILTERYADWLQYGFLAYIRHDWEFPYSQAECRVQGILTT